MNKFFTTALKNATIALLIIFSTSTLIANDNVTEKSMVDDGSEVLGVWQGDNLQERFEIYEKDGKYFGKIVWTAYKDIDNVEGRGLADLNNPDPELRDKSIIGLEILIGFEYKGNGVYTSGKVYDPGSGNTYKCKIKVNGDEAKVRGYILMPLLGRTEIAYRYKE